MAHVTSFKAGGAVGVLKHDERDEKEKVHQRKNESIDSNRTHLNYNMAAPRSGTLMQHIKKVCEDNNVRLSNRKDLNVMCSWVVTAPKTVTPTELPLFFKTCFDFLQDKYGKKYTLSASVHMDETTPHLHYCFIPVGFDNKNNRLTVSSKLVLTRSHLRTFHKELEANLTMVFGRELGIENGATSAGNLTTQELKYKTAVQKTKQAEERLNALQGQILSQEEVNALKGKKTLTGCLRGISYQEYLSLKKTAQKGYRASKTANKLKEENQKLKNEIQILKNELKETQTFKLGKEAILQSNIREKIEKEYDGQYVYRDIPALAQDLFHEISQNVICQSVVRQRDGKDMIVIKCPKSEKRKLDRIIQRYPERQQTMGMQL